MDIVERPFERDIADRLHEDDCLCDKNYGYECISCTAYREITRLREENAHFRKHNKLLMLACELALEIERMDDDKDLIEQAISYKGE